MKLVEVIDNKTNKEFLEVPRVLYKKDLFFVCQLDIEINSVFNISTNPFFSHGEAIRWILKNDKGELIGRVAAFINTRKAFTFQQPTGGMGFFECIDNQGAADLLFNACKKWLEERGMQAMDGPINFGENDNYWGLLVEGFIQPAAGMNYNFPYYRRLFESYGFQQYFEQTTNHLNLKAYFPDRFWRIAERVIQKTDYRFEHFKLKEAERYIRDLKKVYDEAWEFHENFTPIELEFLRAALNKAKIFLDEEFIWFAYHKNEAVAFLVMFPDINMIIKKLNGRSDWWGKLKFLFYLKTQKITRSRVTIMGVSPKYQRMGVESGIFWHMEKVFKRKPWYNEIEISWVGDFNLKMKALLESIGGDFGKRHITYRKLFCGDNIKQRSSFIPVDTKEKISKSAH